MPDVYHYDEETGEVINLFGSVPIDDTQASEETVYSSAKVEAMMEALPTYESITLKSGLSGFVKAAKKNGLITIIIKIDSGLTANSYTTICDLPAKYVPRETFYFSGTSTSSGAVIGTIAGQSYSENSISLRSAAANGYAVLTFWE